MIGLEEIIRLQNYEPFWGEWNVAKMLHEGSLANIYRVENGSSKGIVKVISIPKVQNDFRNASRTLEDTEVMQKFCKEVMGVLEEELERLEALNSIPNVLGYRKYEAFERREEVGYDLVLFMDEEQNLADYVAENHIKNGEIVKIVKDVAWILDKAHQEGIVHKDIKIENIFMSETGESMLADFSLARKIESFQSRDQRRNNNIYTAPEVLSEYDFNNLTDVYALGMVLYSLLNDGEIPFVFENRNAKTSIPAPKRAGDKLLEVVMKAIAYRAKDRYQSAEEFFKALYELKEQDFEMPVEYIEAEKRKQEQLAKKEEEKKRQEEKEREEEKKKQEELARQEEEKKRQEELTRQEEEKKRQEELARQEEEKKRQEELARQEEERKRQEELARQEEERKRQEELARQEEEQKRQEELARQEEEKKRQEELARQEEERKRQEELARQEEEQKRQEELARQEEEKKRQQEQLRREAENERRRMAEEKIKREKVIKGDPSISLEAALFEEETLGGAASQLNSSMEQMEQIAEAAQSEIRKEEGRGSETREKFFDYSIPQEKDELLEEIIASVSEEKQPIFGKNNRIVDNKTLLETRAAQKDGEPEFKLRADITEYGGFFDFSKEAYQSQNNKKEVGYDKNMDTEPFEQKMIDFPKQKVDKKPIVMFFVLVFLIVGGIYISQNKAIRTNLQEVYNNAIQYFSSQSSDTDYEDGVTP